MESLFSINGEFLSDSSDNMSLWSGKYYRSDLQLLQKANNSLLPLPAHIPGSLLSNTFLKFQR